MSVFISGHAPSLASWPRVTRSIVTATAPMPISVADAKAHCRIIVSDDDGQVSNWIRAAVSGIEADAGIELTQKTLDLGFDGFTTGTLIEFPVFPVQSVTAVTYTTSAGVPTVWSASNYELKDTRLALAETASWPTDLQLFRPVVVRVVAGYTSTTLIPADLLHLVRMMTGWLSENRQLAQLEQRYYDTVIARYCRLLVA